MDYGTDFKEGFRQGCEIGSVMAVSEYILNGAGAALATKDTDKSVPDLLEQILRAAEKVHELNAKSERWVASVDYEDTASRIIKRVNRDIGSITTVYRLYKSGEISLTAAVESSPYQSAERFIKEMENWERFQNN